MVASPVMADDIPRPKSKLATEAPDDRSKERKRVAADLVALLNKAGIPARVIEPDGNDRSRRSS